MLRRPLELAELPHTVFAVPPVCWTGTYMLDLEANRRLISHIEAGGVRALLYGGNANLYHFDLKRFEALIDFVAQTSGEQTAFIPSIGPDLGKMIDEVPILKRYGVSDVMVLPTAFPAHERGIETGLNMIADAFGGGLIVYIKREGYLRAEQLERLVAGGAVKFVKYAVERDAPENDAYLDEMVAAIGKDRIASGMGETPIHDHLGARDLASYTSGAVCIAPRAAMEILGACKRSDNERAATISAPFVAFERARKTYGGFGVLHDGVTESGICDTGPILPLLANLTADERVAIRPQVKALLDMDRACQSDIAQAS